MAATEGVACIPRMLRSNKIRGLTFKRRKIFILLAVSSKVLILKDVRPALMEQAFCTLLYLYFSGLRQRIGEIRVRKFLLKSIA